MEQQSLLAKKEVNGIAHMNGATEPTSIMSIIAAMSATKDYDIESMTRLLELQERVMKGQAVIEFNQSLATLSGKLPRIAKHGTSHNNIKYSRYEDIDRAIRPFMSEAGFSLSFDAVPTEDGMIVTGTLSHVGGHSNRASIPLKLDTGGSKNATQAYGSTLSYGKRYTTCMLLNIVTEHEDDDASFVNITPISNEQVKAIKDMIAQTGANEAKYLEYMNVQKVEQIVMRDYNKAITALKAKQAGGK